MAVDHDPTGSAPCACLLLASPGRRREPAGRGAYDRSRVPPGVRGGGNPAQYAARPEGLVRARSLLDEVSASWDDALVRLRHSLETDK